MLAPEMMEKPTMVSFMAAHSNFKSGADTPRAFLERCLATIDHWEPKIGGFVCFNIAGAREAANRSTERWREGKPLSPIDGMPIAVKDIIETIDMPTEMGSPLYSGFRSDRDAASVAALREAGAVILGKAVTTEFAATEPAATRNPWDTARTPGGSSSGSAAAVAVGMVPAALGTQVVGSIIRPSSYCGCYGFKPTVGAINRGGSHDGLSQSAHGAIAASLAEAWQVCYEIAKRVGGDPGFPGLYGPPLAPSATKPRRLALFETAGWRFASEGARAALLKIADAIRATGVDVVRRNDSPQVEKIEAGIAGARAASIVINEWESRWPLNTYRDRDVAQLSRTMVTRLANAEAMTLDDYRVLIAAREASRALFASFAAEVDGVISLSAPAAAPIGLETTGDPSCTVHTSYLGVPAITLPVLQDEGLPLGLQVTGFAHADAAAFALAAWLDDMISARNGVAR